MLMYKKRTKIERDVKMNFTLTFFESPISLHCACFFPRGILLGKERPYLEKEGNETPKEF
jgi:hypothetical protein